MAGRPPKQNRTDAQVRHAAAERERYQGLSPAERRQVVQGRDRSAQQEADRRRHERHRDQRNAENRAYQRERWEDHAPQRKARAAAALLPKQPCAVCGTKKDVEAHHPDYSKPSNVVFLCATHHGEEHQAA